MCAIIKNPLQRDGTSQKDRLAKILLPENAKIDDRRIEEIIAFASEYAKLITYYNGDNQPEGDWSCFYDNDPCILLALLASIDTASIESKFKEWEEKVRRCIEKEEDDSEGCETDPLPGYYDAIINLIYSVAVRIQRTCKRLPQQHPLKAEIIGIIKNNLRKSILDNKQQDALIKLIGYDKASLPPLNNYSLFIKSGSDDPCTCTLAWEMNQEGYDCIYPDNSFNIEALKDLFYVFFVALVQIKAKAKAYFEECILTNDSHQPHITLFLSFLYLFQYSIDHLNTLTATHLLYYYDKVLCLHKKKEVPDKAHIIFELAKNFDLHLVEEGTLLNGGKDDTNKQRVYAMLEELVVNKAKVEQLKTVYIDEQTGIVHAAPKADSKDGLGEKFSSNEQPHWRPLGSKDSPPVELGFALGSPMFFLSEGIRAAMINYKMKKPVNPEIFQQATQFRLQYSSGKDWIEIENIFDAAERILLQYPNLQKLYKDNITLIKRLIKDGFDFVQSQFEKTQQVKTAATPTAVASATTAAKPKAAVKAKATTPLTPTEILGFIEKADVHSVVKFLQAEDAAKKKIIRKEKVTPAEAAAAEEAETPIDEAELLDEIMLVRNDILQLQHVYVNHVSMEREELDFFILANTSAPAFTAPEFDDKNPGIRSDWPIIKTLIKNVTDANGLMSSSYNSLKSLKLIGADIKVAAYGMKNIVVQNDSAILDNSKEIQPFTTRPYKGSYFYVGSREVFQKKLDLVGVQLEWAGKPANFATHYTNYITTGITDQSFRVNAELLNAGIYQRMVNGDNRNLFSNDFMGKTIIALGSVFEEEDEDEGGGVGVEKGEGLTVKSLNLRKDSKILAAGLSQGFELNKLKRDPFLPDFTQVDSNMRRGFLRFNLFQQDFLHDEYPMALMKLTIGATQPITDVSKLIKEPYTPKLKNTSLFYISSERTLFGPNQYNATIEHFYHITPFGYEKLAIDKESEVFLLPRFTNVADSFYTQGNLFIGLKDAKPEQKVNILFQVLEGSGDNRYAPPDIEWSYLVNNEWQLFRPFEIEDHTRADESSRKSLLKSGIVEFSLPKWITSKDSTILDSTLLWIKAVAQENPAIVTNSNLQQGIPKIAALPDLVAVIAQAGIVEFKNQGNSLSHLALPLPAKTISKFIDSRAAIKSVSQPYYSFDGRLPEDNNQFYRRISERLRHKNRAICIWDYERLVLEQYPQVHKVKCLNHTNLLADRELAPGFVTISVIPDLRNKNAANKLEPRVPIGLLDEIKLFLKKRTNLFVASTYQPATGPELDYLQVMNPLYEQIKVNTCVRFHKGVDVAYYKYVLNDELKKFLSPWAFDSNSEINFGSSLHKSAVLNFIEERKYVDVVLGFSVIHYRDGQPVPTLDADHIIPTTSRSIFTSSNTITTGEEYEHSITHIVYNADDPCPTCIPAAVSANNK